RQGYGRKPAARFPWSSRPRTSRVAGIGRHSPSRSRPRWRRSSSPGRRSRLLFEPWLSACHNHRSMRGVAVAYRLWVGLLRSLALLARRVAMRTQAGPMRPWWRLTYELLARSVGLALTAGLPGASVYVAASVASGDPAYG